jgi:hypothetical protein
LNLTGTLPGDLQTITYADKDGSPKTFERGAFVTFFGAMMDYYYKIRAGKSPPQPLVLP